MSVTHAPPVATAARPHLLTLVIAAAVSALAMTMFVPAVPSIARDFATDPALVQLGLSIYLVTTAIVQLAVGPMADLKGRRPVLLYAMMLFVLGTAICVLAPNVTWFLIGRVLQGASSAGLVLSRTIIRDLYGRERAASMIGYVVMAMAVAPMVGPWIGGVIDETFGWRGIFVLLGAVGIVSTLAIWFDLAETNATLGRPLREQVAAYRSLGSNSAYWVFTATGAFASGVFFAFLGAAPQIADTVLGMSPSRYGAWFAFCAGGYALGNFLSGRFAERMGLGRMILLGAIFTLAGALSIGTAFALGFEHPFSLFGFVSLVGIGNGMVLPSNVAAAISIRPDAAGAASGLLGTLQTATGAFAAYVSAALVGDGSRVLWFAAWVIASASLGVLFALLSARVLKRGSELGTP